MKVSADFIINSELYEKIEDDKLPKPVVYRNKATGNCVFIAPNGRGNMEALDRFVVLKDFNGVLAYCKRESGFLKDVGNVFEAIAGILIHATDPRLGLILEFAGAGKEAAKIKDFVTSIGGGIDKSGVPKLLEDLGYEKLANIHAMMKAALEDGLFSVDEWKAIQAAGRELQ